MSARKRKVERAKEMMTVVNGRREDSELHEAILAEGDDARAQAVSAELMRDLGFSDEQISGFFKKDFDPNQPRDEDGKWTSGGGGDGGGTGGDKPKPSAETTPEAKLERIIEDVPGAKEAISSARSKLTQPGSVPTSAPISEGGLRRRDGTWVAPRQAEHARILEQDFSPEKIEAATPKPGEQPVAHLLGGSGGSGKGWYTKPEGTVRTDNAIYINSDNNKERLSNYQGWNAALLHEESSELGKLQEKLARGARLNVIIDGTMGSVKELEQRISAFKAAGYRVEGHFMRVTPETSAKRALERFVRGGETGRFVPPELLMKHAATQNFEKLRDRMDDWELYDNEGKSPKFVERKK